MDKNASWYCTLQEVGGRRRVDRQTHLFARSFHRSSTCVCPCPCDSFLWEIPVSVALTLPCCGVHCHKYVWWLSCKLLNQSACNGIIFRTMNTNSQYVQCNIEVVNGQWSCGYRSTRCWPSREPKLLVFDVEKTSCGYLWFCGCYPTCFIIIPVLHLQAPANG